MRWQQPDAGVPVLNGFDDWRAICALKARYCRLLDTKDWVGFGALYAVDVVLDTTGSGGPRIEGRDAAVAMIRASLEHAVTVHQVHSPEIVVEGDTASAVWAMSDRLTWPDGRRLDGAGHYHERYGRVERGWQIAESRLTRLFVEMRRLPAEEDSLALRREDAKQKNFLAS